MARYTLEEKIKIGQETFYRLLETEYGENVRSEMALKYGLNATYISTCLNMFKNHVVEPKPSMEEILILEKYYTKRCQKLYSKNGNGASKKYEVANTLLQAKTDDDFLELLNNYNTTYIRYQVEDYVKDFPNDKDLIMAKFEKLIILKNANLAKKMEEEKHDIDSNKEAKVIDAIKAYLESNDCYPNYIFNSYKVENYLFNEIVKKAKEENKTDVLALLRTYSKTVDERELEFKNLCLDVCNGINSEKFNILDFYRLTHMPVKKFMLFMRVAAYRRLVGGSIVEKINEFMKKNYYGSYTYKNIDEAIKNINYNYKGVELTPEMIASISSELFEQDIPIDRNSIILTFQEKINQKVNKR